MHAAIEIVDLPLDFALPEGEGNRDQRILAGRPHGGGGQHVREVTDRVLARVARQPLEHDGAIDVVRRAGGEHA